MLSHSYLLDPTIDCLVTAANPHVVMGFNFRMVDSFLFIVPVDDIWKKLLGWT